MWCKKPIQSTKKVERDLFHVKSFAVQKWLTWCLQYSAFRLMIYLSFRSIIPKSRKAQCRRYLCEYRVIIRWHKKLRWNDKEMQKKATRERDIWEIYHQWSLKSTEWDWFVLSHYRFVEKSSQKSFVTLKLEKSQEAIFIL